MMGVVVSRSSLERRPGMLARSSASPVTLFQAVASKLASHATPSTEKKYNISGCPALPHANQLTDLSKLIIFCGNKSPVLAVYPAAWHGSIPSRAIPCTEKKYNISEYPAPPHADQLNFCINEPKQLQFLYKRHL